MSNTPRTDAFARTENILGLENLGLVPADFARSLEREVNMLRELTKRPYFDDQIPKLTKERDDALLAYKILEDSYKMLRQANIKLRNELESK